MTEQIYARRGELVAIIGQDMPKTASRVRASIFWLGREPLACGKEYKLKIGSAAVGCRLERIAGVINAATLESKVKDCVERHEVADCELHLDRPIAFDPSGEVPDSCRFVIVDDYEISGGGIIKNAFDGDDIGERLEKRNIKWIKSSITARQRSEYYGQSAHLIVITGKTETDKKTVARELEKRLLDRGKIAYYLGLGNLLYGVNADIKSERSMIEREERAEHIRRLGETANIMLDAGNILIVTANELDFDELDTLRRTVSLDAITTVWVGEMIHSHRDFDLYYESGEGAAERIENAIFR